MERFMIACPSCQPRKKKKTPPIKPPTPTDELSISAPAVVGTFPRLATPSQLESPLQLKPFCKTLFFPYYSATLCGLDNITLHFKQVMKNISAPRGNHEYRHHPSKGR
ncbi:hypothetical protein [Desulfobotulus alkaliphilus]|uniref:hypothetical protein n=1 Tax=Desulfobotulus alkaliphilus TaxID=622671 RepID=UPI0011A0CBB7|nr:hypothetical protein [Desulfobotulus alkaliphilus]